jgi:hypothetical protein
VITSEFDDPASTTKLLPLLVRLNAAEANGEKSATATAKSLVANMVNVNRNRPGYMSSRHVGQALLCDQISTLSGCLCRQSVLDQDSFVQMRKFHHVLDKAGQGSLTCAPDQ